MKYAEVAVNSPLAQRRSFSYSIPPHLSVVAGQAVWVPFGPRVLQGIALKLTDVPGVPQTRDIIDVIAPEPLLSPAQIELAIWISQHYLSPLFDAVALMLPPGFERRLISYIQATDREADSPLTSPQRQVLALLQKKGKIRLEEIEKALGKKQAQAVVGQLLRRNLISKTQVLSPSRVRPKLSSAVRLIISPEQASALRQSSRLGTKQAALLELLAAEGRPLLLTEVQQRVGCLPSTVKSLENKGLLVVERLEQTRDPLSRHRFSPAQPPILTLAQQAVWSIIRDSLEQRPKNGAVFLLHGVTGSGKTEIYLRALARVVELGQRGIVLVPEIALTPQTIERFAARFPGRVAVLHSKLSLGEQFDEWRRIQQGDFDVVIGSRGAVFAPQPDLGLIVIDEEHEWTYKQQEQSPRYHAREVAIKLSELRGAVVILGSATPDLESYHKALSGHYQMLRLPERIVLGEEVPLPRVEVVDMRQELKAGNRSIFSRSLEQSIAQALEAQEQVILFLNRRGTSSFVQCRDCGFTMRCQRCELSLTYHSDREELICHQCNARWPLPTHCPQCWSQRIRFLGIGTQKVAEITGSYFPKARLLRWDRDATRGKYSHQEIVECFSSHQADILVGTQMLAKGLDFPLVTLVGVILADVALNLPDFRAGERTFQLLSQVAGRAGRGVLGGKVIVQTYSPDHYAIQTASEHNYELFYQKEIGFRREQNNPPFSHLSRLLYTHTNSEKCQREAERIHRLLVERRDALGIGDISLIGPAPAFFQRIRGHFRWQLVVRGADPAALLAEVPLPQGWTVDVDPASLL